MSSATERKPKASKQADSAESRYAVLFELEGIAGSGRQAAYEVLRSLLAEQGFEVDPAHISRFCLHPEPEVYVPVLLEALGAGRQAVGKLVEDVRSGIAMQLVSKSTTLPGATRKLLEAAREAKAPLAALTALPEATAEALMDNLGLKELGVRLFPVENNEEDDHFPRADNWLKVAKTLNRSPFDCGVIATTHAACKSALSAGMRCVALPDVFTACEDFSGANGIVESLDAVRVGDVLLDLCPHINE